MSLNDTQAEVHVFDTAQVENIVKRLSTTRVSSILYCLDWKGGPLLKIGTATCVQQRMRNYVYMCPENRYELLYVMAGERTHERALHDMLSAYREVGEWFLREPVLALLKMCRRQNRYIFLENQRILGNACLSSYNRKKGVCHHTRETK